MNKASDLHSSLSPVFPTENSLCLIFMVMVVRAYVLFLFSNSSQLCCVLLPASLHRRAWGGSRAECTYLHFPLLLIEAPGPEMNRSQCIQAPMHRLSGRVSLHMVGSTFGGLSVEYTEHQTFFPVSIIYYPDFKVPLKYQHSSPTVH